ncbi:hypothetical protein MLD38_023637 [Melastoma candidum]|uniref:Uncharacterized protein n=1 Tax=Melastoma candidum TaxID=119954 RepID=A0ACB9NSP8_9MYRT|nr:hypothetical protein MLD38_023637 [Melastoma candidum]
MGAHVAMHSHTNSKFLHFISTKNPPNMKLLITLAILSLAAATSLAYDPDLLQDICVAINNTDDGVFVNGKFCKDPKMATADDFVFTKFRTPGNTDNPLGSKRLVYGAKAEAAIAIGFDDFIADALR